MKVIASNRKARHDYSVDHTLLAGIALNGGEVKSIKAGHISLKGSFVTINQGELYLINAHVTPYKFAASADEPTRRRKLLVHKNELTELVGFKQQGLAMVPLAVGLVRGLVKVEIGIGRGRKKYDKRQVLKKREAERAIARVLKPRKS